MYQQICELVYNDLKAKQKDISRLFPSFDQRVKDVAMGGSYLQKPIKQPDRWHFKVASGTTKGKWYDVYIQWVNPEETLEKLIADRSIWKKDGSGVNLMKLSLRFMHECDIRTFCSCPADLYWGGQYIRTKDDAKFTNPERRPPEERNPREYGAFCKHTQLTMNTLHAHSGDCAKWLRTFYSKKIAELEAKYMVGADQEQEQPSQEEQEPQGEE